MLSSFIYQIFVSHWISRLPQHISIGLQNITQELKQQLQAKSKLLFNQTRGQHFKYVLVPFKKDSHFW